MLRKIFLILILNMVNGLEWYEKGNPIFLEGDQIKKSLEQKDQIKVVKFFVSWCGHCRTLKRYVDNYKKNKELNEGFNIYEINCDVSP